MCTTAYELTLITWYFNCAYKKEHRIILIIYVYQYGNILSAFYTEIHVRRLKLRPTMNDVEQNLYTYVKGTFGIFVYTEAFIITIYGVCHEEKLIF